MSNILVVDDTPANLRLLMEILLQQGHHVRPVREGNLAITAAQLDPPDLILLDVKMPAPDGFAVCEILKADPRTREIPVIFLTILDDLIDKVKGFEVGGVDYITKPFETTELLARVENQLRLRSLQQQLIEQQQFLRTIYNDVEAAISVIDVLGDGEFRIADINNTFLRMSGLSRTQLEGANLRNFLPQETIQRHHLICTEQVRPITAEEPVILNGKTTWWLSTHTPLVDTHGQVKRLVGTSLNITERKQAEMKLAERTQELSRTLHELKDTQNKLVESAKMAALGNLVAGVAHEINTPLGTAITAASTLESELSILFHDKAASQQVTALTEYLDVIEECNQLVLSNLQRAGELVQSFKQVAVDQTSLKQRTFQVRTYLDEVITSLTPQIKRTSHTVLVLGEEVTIHSYPGGLSQVITNLLLNSLGHAFAPEESGQIQIRVTAEPDGCVIEYSDNGTGIPPEHLNRIFEPFFTTARHKGGSGLGLHLVYNLVTQQLKGSITVHSEAGVGTQFTISLPLSL